VSQEGRWQPQPDLPLRGVKGSAKQQTQTEASETDTSAEAVEGAVGACLSAHEYGGGNADPEDGVLLAAYLIRALAAERDALREELRRKTEVPVVPVVPVVRPVVRRGVWRAAHGELRCPTCGAVERHPTLKNAIVIRGLKVYDEHGAWSQCLRCSGLYSADLSTHDEENHDPAKGWFVT